MLKQTACLDNTHKTACQAKNSVQKQLVESYLFLEFSNRFPIALEFFRIHCKCNKHSDVGQAGMQFGQRSAACPPPAGHTVERGILPRNNPQGANKRQGEPARIRRVPKITAGLERTQRGWWQRQRKQHGWWQRQR